MRAVIHSLFGHKLCRSNWDRSEEGMKTAVNLTKAFSEVLQVTLTFGRSERHHHIETVPRLQGVLGRLSNRDHWGSTFSKVMS